MSYSSSKELISPTSSSVSAPIKLSTEHKLEYNFFPNSSGLVEFKVRAANDAHIALAGVSDETGPMYEVFLGCSKNTLSVIRKHSAPKDVAEVRRSRVLSGDLRNFLSRRSSLNSNSSETKTPGILNEREFRNFWIRWSSGTICAGHQGNTTPFISYTDSESVPINYVGFRTGLGASGTWVIKKPTSTAALEPLELTTGSKLEYKFFRNSSGQVEFKVRAAEAHIALVSGAAETSPLYEIFIGCSKHTKSIIRKNLTKCEQEGTNSGGVKGKAPKNLSTRKSSIMMSNVVEAKTLGILNDKEFRSFWISWKQGNIAAGHQGNTSPFINFTDSESVQINFVGVRSGLGAVGTWIIERPPITNALAPIELSTENILKYDCFPNSSGLLEFKVRAPFSAQAALNKTAAETHPTYEVIIGGWENTKSAIRKNRDKELVQVNTPEILSETEFKGFWIRWKNRTISVGYEGNFAPFLSYTDSESVPINYVGVCTCEGASGSWIIERPIKEIFWVAAKNGNVPFNAFQGGEEDGEPLYIIRAKYDGNTVPGKLLSSQRISMVGWKGKEKAVPEYEVLCNFDGGWSKCEGNNIPSNAVAAGETREGEQLYVGRASHEGILTVGKVHPSLGACVISCNGQEISYGNYEILIF